MGNLTFSNHLSEYHGINGNMSLDRRAGELSLTLGTLHLQKPDSSTLESTKSQSSLSKSEGTVYDVSQAERNAAAKMIDANGNNSNTGTMKNGNNGVPSRKVDKSVLHSIDDPLIGSFFFSLEMAN